MGRWDDGKGGLAHREGIRQEHRGGEVGAARSATHMCSPLPRIGRRVGADPISFGARFGANDRTLPWLQTANSIGRQRSHWHRAESLSWVSGCGRVADHLPRKRSKQFVVSVIEIFRQPFECITELQRNSAAVIARLGEARLDDYASSLAVSAG